MRHRAARLCVDVVHTLVHTPGVVCETPISGQHPRHPPGTTGRYQPRYVTHGPIDTYTDAVPSRMFGVVSANLMKIPSGVRTNIRTTMCGPDTLGPNARRAAATAFALSGQAISRPRGDG